MNVIKHKKHTWFLLESDGVFYLDGNYNNSFIGYSWGIKLNHEEGKKYKENGIEYIEDLYGLIQDSCPICKNTKSSYLHRKVSEEKYQEIHSAIMAWNSE